MNVVVICRDGSSSAHLDVEEIDWGRGNISVKVGKNKTYYNYQYWTVIEVHDD